VHSNLHGQSFRREEGQSGQGASSDDGTRGNENSRRGTNEQKQNCEPRSGELTVDVNPNLLDMSKLPPIAMALLQQLLAMISDKGKDPVEEKEINKGDSGTATKMDVPESSAQGEARSNSEFGKPPYCYKCLSRGHSKEGCVAQLVWEICDSTSHVMARCSLHKNAVKSFAAELEQRVGVALHTRVR
jgi:hypothetical protein